MESLFKNYTFILHKKQDDYIEDLLYEDRKKEVKERNYPNNERSEVVRKMINDHMKKNEEITA